MTLARKPWLEFGVSYVQPIDNKRLVSCVEGRRIVADRKSTRLNSSHLGISYAVFCLKKKVECVQAGCENADGRARGTTRAVQFEIDQFFFNEAAPAELHPSSLPGPSSQ